jgi:hypothetical protein
MRSVVLASLVCFLATNVNSTAMAAKLGRMETVRDQGVLYLKRQRPKLALSYLNRVFKTPAGSKDFRTVLSRGRAAFVMLRLDIAANMIELAKDLATAPRQQRQYLALRDEFRNGYGSVRVVTHPGETRVQGQLKLEITSNLISKNKRKRFLSVQTRLASAPVRLPARVYLPHGIYRMNGVEFRILEKGKEPTIKVFVRQFTADASAKKRFWWWLGSGVLAATVVGVAAVVVLNEPEAQYRDVLRLQIE